MGKSRPGHPSTPDDLVCIKTGDLDPGGAAAELNSFNHNTPGAAAMATMMTLD